MNSLEVIDVVREAMWIIIKISLPLMMVALVVGLIISLFQALTQIQEMTLSFVPKMVAIFLAIIFLFPFISTTLKDYHERLTDRIIALDDGNGDL